MVIFNSYVKLPEGSGFVGWSLFDCANEASKSGFRWVHRWPGSGSIPRLGMDTKWFRWGVHKPYQATERLSHDWNFWRVYRCFQGPLPDPSGIGSSAPIEVCDSCQARKRSNMVKRPEQLETISKRSVVFLVPLFIVQESYSKNAKQKK